MQFCHGFTPFISEEKHLDGDICKERKSRTQDQKEEIACKLQQTVSKILEEYVAKLISVVIFANEKEFLTIAPQR